MQLAQLLTALPSKQSTRITIARMIGEITDGTAADAFVEYRNLCELGGFDVSGRRWELFVRLGGEPS